MKRKAIPKIEWDIPYLEELYTKDMPMEDRWRAYISCHPEQMTFGSFKAIVSRLGFRTREYIPCYTEEQKEFLRNNYAANGITDTTRMFNEKFGMNKTPAAIKRASLKLGVKVDKEIKWRDKKRIYDGCRHEIGDVVILKRKGVPFAAVVTDRVDATGIKGGSRYHYTSLVRYNYEQAYGKLDKGYKVIPLDGDMTNADLSNLRAVPVQYVPQLSRWNDWYGKGEVTDAAIKYIDLAQTINKELKRLNEE